MRRAPLPELRALIRRLLNHDPGAADGTVGVDAAELILHRIAD